MFCQLKNSLKYVNIRPCHRMTCECYQKFNDRVTEDTRKNGLKIDNKEHKKYKVCYTSNEVPGRDIFLL